MANGSILEINDTFLATDESHQDADYAKILAIFALGLGSFFTGILPSAISNYNRQRFPLVTSLMLCFGAGVLLATALVHMLPDVRKSMPKNAEITFCSGFFIVYFIDEFIHYFFGEAIQHSHEKETRNLSSNQITRNQGEDHSHSHNHNSHNYGSTLETDALLPSINHNDHPPCNTDDANARICHTSHTEPCVQTMTGTLGLLVALSLHSLIEGLAIGVQNSQSKVLFLLGAVACHKYVMSFCLGLEFRSNPTTTLKSQFILIGVFAFGSVVGIGVGMAVVDIPSTVSSTALPILQALAGGTLLYVTVCEVMPREKARWHQNLGHRSAGLSQFFAVGIGFAVMVLINFYLDDD